jgi:mono/diheme cytochrome c family protein
MSDESTLEATQTEAPASNRWLVWLGAAVLLVTGLTAGIFWYGSRAIFAKASSRSTSGSALEALAAPKVDPMANVVSLEHGLAVYNTNCASCHGPEGLGDGPAAEPPDPAPAMIPKPRNFSSGWFKIGTTKTGLPTDEDIAATIRHGMLPSAMPPWVQLTDGEVKSLVLAIRHLAIEARVAEKLERDPKFPREKALEMAHAQLDPGPVIVLPPKPPTFDLDRGKAFYTANCAACHDPDGRAKLRTDLVDNDDNPILPRDFASPLFKGGNQIDDIAMRIVRGIPGSPMPANPDISAADLWSTAAYVRAFAQPQGEAKAK